MSSKPTHGRIWIFVAGFLSGGLVVAVVAWCMLLVLVGPLMGPGSQDYGYDLCAGYRLTRSSSHEVSIWSEVVGDSRLEIGPKVVGLAWDDEFILVERQEIGADRKPILDRFDFWIIAAGSARLHGPMDHAEFVRTRSDLGVPDGLRLRDPRWYR